MRMWMCGCGRGRLLHGLNAATASVLLLWATAGCGGAGGGPTSTDPLLSATGGVPALVATNGGTWTGNAGTGVGAISGASGGVGDLSGNAGMGGFYGATTGGGGSSASQLPQGGTAPTIAGAGGQALAGGSAGGATGTAGAEASAGAAPVQKDHCVFGYDPDPTDATLAPSFAEFVENGQTDATVQPEVIAWMEKQKWQESHFQWHQVRRCGGGGLPGGDGGDVDPCQYPEMLPEANECENAQDGYEFLVMHRHMLQSLKQLWPNHTEQFEGWDQFPTEQDYPEILRGHYQAWSQSVQQDAAIADNIADNMGMFASEGEFGLWLQCGSIQGGMGMGSLHGSLHFNGYPPQNQSHSVTNQRRNLDSYVFWKLHGWIDKVWERYRIANGQAPDEPKLKDELVAQCREMDTLSQLIDPSLIQPDEPVDLPNEAGFFHEVVRPGLEDFGCATCHGAGEEAGLRLGFNVSSTEIVERLVNADSAYSVGYKLVVPGDPDSSWLYLKASRQSPTSGATCQGVMNCTQGMPPGMGEALPPEDLESLRQWILDGAPAPTLLPTTL